MIGFWSSILTPTSRTQPRTIWNPFEIIIMLSMQMTIFALMQKITCAAVHVYCMLDKSPHITLWNNTVTQAEFNFCQKNYQRMVYSHAAQILYLVNGGLWHLLCITVGHSAQCRRTPRAVSHTLQTLFREALIIEGQENNKFTT